MRYMSMQDRWVNSRERAWVNFDERQSYCVFRTNVTARFGIVTAEFGNVTGHFGNVTEASFGRSSSVF